MTTPKTGEMPNINVNAAEGLRAMMGHTDSVGPRAILHSAASTIDALTHKLNLANAELAKEREEVVKANDFACRLRRYAQHESGCFKTRLGYEYDKDRACTCGLEALLND